jgi:hypothetical protein
MSIKDKYYIKEISYKEAMELIVKYHYLHRKASCSYAFGLFEKDTNEIVGVITYGSPVSSTLCKGICGEEYKDEVIELTRLWVKDGTPKNTESFFIGNTIKRVPKKIIVSFADPSVGHIGTVYQATNWIYTGLSAKRKRWRLKNNDINHNHRAITQKYTYNEIREKFSDIMEYVDAPRKHRYIYFNCNKKEKEILMKKLRYKVHKYPKRQN